jgi:predicted lipid-binding transport protein (Tim44 family)
MRPLLVMFLAGLGLVTTAGGVGARSLPRGPGLVRPGAIPSNDAARRPAGQPGPAPHQVEHNQFDPRVAIPPILFNPDPVAVPRFQPPPSQPEFDPSIASWVYGLLLLLTGLGGAGIARRASADLSGFREPEGGNASGAGPSSPGHFHSSAPHPGQDPPAWPVPPLEDLILSPAEVQPKAEETTRLLGELARSDPAFDPGPLAVSFAHTFTLVQRCWQDRDYRPMRDLLVPALLARLEEQLQPMRGDGLVSRIDDLLIRRLEFVRVCCGADPAEATVTALITFGAKVYFVRASTGQFVRGSQKVIPYQEFWTFRRDGDVWRVQAIEQGDEAGPLAEPNRVPDGAKVGSTAVMKG